MTPVAVPTRRGHRPWARPDVLAAIAAGGMLGATARYAIGQALPSTPGHFPWATLWINLSGSFVLGFCLVVLLERLPPTRLIRPFLATGVIGAYTTMSTFLVDATVLFQHGHVLTALAYVGATLGAGLVLAYAGVISSRAMTQRGPARTRQGEAR